MVDAGLITLARAIEAFTVGPGRVLGPAALGRGVGLVEGAPADLVVFDRSEGWAVDAGSLASRGKNSPLIGRDVPGRVLLTIAAGRVAWDATA
jgi:dihydroorotase